MCPTQEFFDKREKVQLLYEKLGFELIEEFMEKHRVSLNTLLDAGLVIMKATSSADDLVNFEVTAKGKQFMAEDRNVQLVFIKSDKIDELKQYCEKTPGP